MPVGYQPRILQEFVGLKKNFVESKFPIVSAFLNPYRDTAIA